MMQQQARNIDDITQAVQRINDLMVTAEEIARGNTGEYTSPGIVQHCTRIGTDVNVCGYSCVLSNVLRPTKE